MSMYTLLPIYLFTASAPYAVNASFSCKRKGGGGGGGIKMTLNLNAIFLPAHAQERLV